MTKKTPEKPSRYFSKEEKARIAGERLAKRAQAAKKKVKSAVEEGSGESILPVVAKFPKKGLPIETSDGETVLVTAAEFAHLARCVSDGYTKWGENHKQHTKLESAGLIRYENSGHYWEPTAFGRKFVVKPAAGAGLKKVATAKAQGEKLSKRAQEAKKKFKKENGGLSFQEKEYLNLLVHRSTSAQPTNKLLLGMARKGLCKYVKSREVWRITSKGKVLHQSLKILDNIAAVQKVMYEGTPIAIEQGTTGKTTLSDARKSVERITNKKIWVATLSYDAALNCLDSLGKYLPDITLVSAWIDKGIWSDPVIKVAMYCCTEDAKSLLNTHVNVKTVTLLDKPPAHAIPWSKQ